MQSITEISQGRNLPQVLRELYQKGRQAYILFGHTENKRLSFSAFWPIPQNIIWELEKYSADGYDFPDLFLRVIHPVDIKKIGKHYRFFSLDELKAKDAVAF